MWLVVGLGNPGDEYAATRHNAGFMLVDRLARAWGVELRGRLFKSRTALVRRAGEEVLLVQPKTFMNRSGTAVGAALAGKEAGPERLVRSLYSTIVCNFSRAASELSICNSVAHPIASPQRSFAELSRPAKFALVTQRRLIAQRKEETLSSRTSGKSTISHCHNDRACELRWRLYCSLCGSSLPTGSGSSSRRRVARGTTTESKQWVPRTRKSCDERS